MTGDTGIRAIIVRHVESYQTPNSEDPSTSEYSLLSIQHAASKLREELESEALIGCFANSISLHDPEVDAGNAVSGESNNSSNSMDQAEKQTSEAILEVIQAALAVVVSSKTSSVHALRKASFYESTCRVLDFVAVFASIPSSMKGSNSNDDAGMRMDSLPGKVLDFVSKFTVVDMESVRILMCSFVGRYIQNLSYHRDNARHGDRDLNKHLKEKHISEEYWKDCLRTTSDILCPRLEDKSVAVRSATLESFSRLFEKEQNQRKYENETSSSLPNDYSHIIEGMLFNLAHDTSLANRSLAVKSIPVTEETIPWIIERVKDAKVKVRVDALCVLRKKVDVRDLSLEHRLEILRSGLTDRCPETFTATAQMLCSGWMKAVKFDPIATLRLLDPPTSEIISQRTAKILLGVGCKDFINEGDQSLDKALVDLNQNEVQAYKESVLRAMPNNETDDLDLNILDPATILFVRVICDLTTNSKTMTEVKKANRLSRIMPDIPVLGGILEKHVGYLNQCANESSDKSGNVTDCEEREDNASFVCLQLLRLARISDLKEEGSRRHFSSIIHRMLCSSNTHDDLIEDCVLVAACCYDTDSHFIQAISEILADTIDMDESSCNHKIREEHYIRAMGILSVVLENISPKIASNPTFQNFSDLILSTITDTQSGPLVREAGVSCLGRYALLSSENTIIDTFKPLLMNVAFRGNETSEIRAQAMLNIADLAVLFDRMHTPILLTDITPAEVSVSDLLLQTISCSNKALVIVAAECAAKLLFAGKCYDINIVAQLIMIYFDRDFARCDEDEGIDEVGEVGSPARLQQLLTLFFPAYSMRTKIGRDTLNASINPLLVLVNKKIEVKGKKQAVWPIAKMVEYICVTVDEGENVETMEDTGDLVNENKAQDPSAVLVMANNVSEFLIREGDDLHLTYLRTLSKILGKVYVDIKTEQSSAVHALKSSLDELAMLITDGIALRSLNNLVQILEDFDVNDDDDESGRQSESETECIPEASVSHKSNDLEKLTRKLCKEYESKSVKQKDLDNQDNCDDSESIGGISKSEHSLDSRTSLLEGLKGVKLNGKDNDEIPTSVSLNSTSLENTSHKNNSTRRKALRIDSTKMNIPAFAAINDVQKKEQTSLPIEKRVKDESNVEISVFKKKVSKVRHDVSIPLFASIDGKENKNRSTKQTRTQKKRIIDPGQEDLTDNEDGSSSDSCLSVDDSDIDDINNISMKENQEVGQKCRQTRTKQEKMQKQRIIESEDDVSTDSGASSTHDDLSEYNTSESEQPKNKTLMKSRSATNIVINKMKSKTKTSFHNLSNTLSPSVCAPNMRVVKKKTPVRRRSKRKEITPLNKGRVPMRPRRKLADVNY